VLECEEGERMTGCRNALRGEDDLSHALLRYTLTDVKPTPLRRCTSHNSAAPRTRQRRSTKQCPNGTSSQSHGAASLPTLAYLSSLTHVRTSQQSRNLLRSRLLNLLQCSTLHIRRVRAHTVFTYRDFPDYSARKRRRSPSSSTQHSVNPFG